MATAADSSKTHAETTLELHDVSEASLPDVRARLLANAATLLHVTLVQPGFGRPLDLTDLPWHTLARLRNLSLQRFQVPASLLAHPTLESLRLVTCPIVGAESVHVGPSLAALELVDCNPEVATLHVDGPALTSFVLSQDEDAAESNFATVRFACPGLQALRFRAALAVDLVFVGPFPALAAANIQLQAGAYGGPVVDVSAAESAALLAAAAPFAAP